MPITLLRKMVTNCMESTSTYPKAKLTEIPNRNVPNALSEVTVEKLPPGTIWFSVDHKSKGSKWSYYLTNVNGINKRCDYVMITEIESIVYTIFIELKSSTLSRDDLKAKFLASECFLDFCHSICKKFYNSTGIANARKRYIVFQKTASLNKLPTRLTSKDGDTPDNPRIINNPNRPKLKQLT